MNTNQDRVNVLIRQGLKVQFGSGPQGDRYSVMGRDGTPRTLSAADLKLLDETGKLTWQGIVELGNATEQSKPR
jgi:hypothetical protein